jgi:hypothetical protein
MPAKLISAKPYNRSSEKESILKHLRCKVDFHRLKARLTFNMMHELTMERWRKNFLYLSSSELVKLCEVLKAMEKVG